MHSSVEWLSEFLTFVRGAHQGVRKSVLEGMSIFHHLWPCHGFPDSEPKSSATHRRGDVTRMRIRITGGKGDAFSLEISGIAIDVQAANSAGEEVLIAASAGRGDASPKHS
jgi:hypothetical protein